MASGSSFPAIRFKIKTPDKLSVGSYIPFYSYDGAEPDAPAASRVICLLSLHFLAETTLMGVLSSVILLWTSWFSLVWKDPNIFLCLTAGLTAA